MRPNKNYRQDKLPSRDYYELRNHLFWTSDENWFLAIPLTLACVFLVAPGKKVKNVHVGDETGQNMVTNG